MSNEKVSKKLFYGWWTKESVFCVFCLALWTIAFELMEKTIIHQKSI